MGNLKPLHSAKTLIQCIESIERVSGNASTVSRVASDGPFHIRDIRGKHCSIILSICGQYTIKRSRDIVSSIPRWEAWKCCKTRWQIDAGTRIQVLYTTSDELRRPNWKGRSLQFSIRELIHSGDVFGLENHHGWSSSAFGIENMYSEVASSTD